ncbi:MAG: NUDIX domain-containing protein [Lachnospiraceae bacterium]|jgi:8-oxo-dGTP diphosphatase|nr:NUDIX domain-containing protein [Lachnospiraceae bacterium]
MERWDLYTADREKTGRSMLRGETIPAGCYQLVVGIWTMNAQGQILLTLRDPKKMVYPNTWENSGGAAQMGESSRQAAVRELQEETGIAAAEQELQYVGTVVRESGARSGGSFIDTYLLHRDIALADIQLQEGETVDARWVTPDELDALCRQGVVARPVAERWAQFKEKIMKEGRP